MFNAAKVHSSKSFICLESISFYRLPINTVFYPDIAADVYLDVSLKFAVFVTFLMEITGNIITQYTINKDSAGVIAKLLSTLTCGGIVFQGSHSLST